MVRERSHYVMLVLCVVLRCRLFIRSGSFCFVQAEDGIRDLVRSRGLGDVYKRQLGHGEAVYDVGAGQTQAHPLTLLHGDHLGRPASQLSLIHI